MPPAPAQFLVELLEIRSDQLAVRETVRPIGSVFPACNEGPMKGHSEAHQLTSARDPPGGDRDATAAKRPEVEEFAVWALGSVGRGAFTRRYEKMSFDQREDDGSGSSPERRIGRVQAADVAGAGDERWPNTLLVTCCIAQRWF